jgi:hypothetical protein
VPPDAEIAYILFPLESSMTALTTHEAFYADLITRNRGFESDEAPDRLAQITVLVAALALRDLAASRESA